MTQYEVEYSYDIPEWGAVTIEADTPEEAEQLAREYVYENFSEVKHFEVENTKEINI